MYIELLICERLRTLHMCTHTHTHFDTCMHTHVHACMQPTYNTTCITHHVTRLRGDHVIAFYARTSANFLPRFSLVH